MTGMEEDDIRCPECGLLTSVDKEKCPNCGFELKEWMDGKELDELLSKVDDETYEVKDLDSDALVKAIRNFGTKDKDDESVSEDFEEEDEEVTYECPLCGTEVDKDAEKCPGCGALFRD